MPDTPATTARFGLIVDDDNGAHIRFRLFAATGGQHLGGCGQLVMRPAEYAAFKQLLKPLLTDRPDPPAELRCAERPGQPQNPRPPGPDHSPGAANVLPDIACTVPGHCDDFGTSLTETLKDPEVRTAYEAEADLQPSPAQLGDTLTITPGEWTPLDDIGTQLYLYGNQPADIAVQRAEVEDELRQLRRDVEVHERCYLAVQKVLDGALGTEATHGTGGGLVADVALLAQRYTDLKARTVSGGWPLVVEEVETAELRAAANPVMDICGDLGRCRSCMTLDPDGSGCGSTYPRTAEA